MKFTGTFLNSKVAQRIAILLFIAAIIPTLLMTVLSSNKVNQLVSKYEHQLLLEKTRNYALSVFANLIYARNYFKHAGQLETDTNRLEQLSINVAKQNVAIFEHVFKIPVNQTNNNQNLPQAIDHAIMLKLDQIDRSKTNILTLQKTTQTNKKTIYLARYVQDQKLQPHYILGQLSENYLWGKQEEHPRDIQLCAYQLVNNAKQRIFCSSEQPIVISDDTETNAINSANWELFLNGEFFGDAWVFEVNRTQPLSKNHLKEFVGSGAYISIAITSLLIVGLLSLIQIRRTMGPLESLVDGTHKIKSGDYAPIEIKCTSEFLELADAFNGMSAHIKQQLDTMESFSTIDRKIVSNIDVEQVSNLVLKRMQQLEENAIFCIAYLEESSSNEVQCKCTISGHDALNAIRLSLTPEEIEVIERNKEGSFNETSLTSEFVHERLMAELGANQIWVLPVLWQGVICAFIAVGNKKRLDVNNHNWHEFRELATRIGIVISAQTREKKLLLEAQYDSLTGLPNRILLQDRLKLAMDHADRNGNPMWVVFIDIDRFKVINDSMGHAAGDALLTEIGKRLEAEVRETDTVARFGGDEFVVVLASDVDENSKLSILNRLMKSISEPIYINNSELINTCSMGVSTYPNDGKSAEILIKNADIAMYRAKELGRNNYQFFTQNLNDKATERMQIISLLHKAIENNEFSLHYQPKVDLETMNIVGVEALIRWENSILGSVPPERFISIAEEAGLIIPIGEWIFRTGCMQLAEWQNIGLGKLLLSINISAKQFQQDNLVETIEYILIETGAKAENLELELTETLLMSDSVDTLKILQKIKALDIQLSIDDFGTGYSSLSYLNKLPVDTLKIDKSFTDTLTPNTKESPIVNSILSLAKNLKLKVVAEGTESAHQVEYLKTHGCNQVQGYYFSKPVSAKEITAMLASDKKLSEAQLVKTVM